VSYLGICASWAASVSWPHCKQWLTETMMLHLQASTDVILRALFSGSGVGSTSLLHFVPDAVLHHHPLRSPIQSPPLFHRAMVASSRHRYCWFCEARPTQLLFISPWGFCQRNSRLLKAGFRFQYHKGGVLNQHMIQYDVVDLRMRNRVGKNHYFIKKIRFLLFKSDFFDLNQILKNFFCASK